MRRLTRVTWLATVIAVSAQTDRLTRVAAQSAVPPVPTFKAQVEYVEVDVVATDQQGQLVRGLTKDDFQVLEDGKLQTITNFSTIDIPVERQDRPLFAAEPIEPDVQSNERPFDGRVYVMILDDVHVAPSRTPRVRAAARQFIERNLGANDLMAVISTGGRSRDAQEFTSNKRLLLQAVDRFMGQKLDSALVARTDEYFRQTIDPDRIMDPQEAERIFKTRAMLSSLRQVAEWFGGVRGRRKTMLLFSEGIDYDVSDITRQYDSPASSSLEIMRDIREAIAATARANVSIYAVDPRGLANAIGDSIDIHNVVTDDNPQKDLRTRGLDNELRLSQDSLRQIAEQTGGFAAINSNDFGDAFDRIVRDNSSYYVLAYYPPDSKRDGRFHRIEVKVKRPGVTVRSRRGYSSPRGKPPAQNTSTGGGSRELADAINSPIPLSGVGVRVFAAPFRGTPQNASVALGVELAGRDLTLENNGKVEVSFMAVDAAGKVFSPRNDLLTFNMRPETRVRVEASGVRFVNRLDLPPGRYQLRVAVRDVTRGTVGSIVHDLEVPDFFKVPIGLSGLVLTSLSSAAMMNARNDAQFQAALPAPPVAERRFAANDEIALFTEIYDNSGKTPHKVDVTTAVLSDGGRILFKSQQERDSSELQGATGSYGYTVRVPLSDIPPGAYVLRVDARSRLGADTSTTRQVQFQVLPRVGGAQQ